MKKVVVMAVLLLSLSMAYADDSCVTSINLPQACPGLDYSNNITDNPYYYKNPNTICGINIGMFGLPTFGFLNGQLKIGDLSFCSLLKGVVKGNVLDELHHLLPSFVVHPPSVGI